MTGMNPDRADVLGAGALVLASALTLFGFPQLVASDWGLREGIILQALGHIDPVRDTQSRPLRLGGTWAGRQRKGRQAGSKRAAAGSR
jgi:exopolyphosphatase/pppGpp-phosphohydrolase